MKKIKIIGLIVFFIMSHGLSTSVLAKVRMTSTEVRNCSSKDLDIFYRPNLEDALTPLSDKKTFYKNKTLLPAKHYIKNFKCQKLTSSFYKQKCFIGYLYNDKSGMTTFPRKPHKIIRIYEDENGGLHITSKKGYCDQCRDLLKCSKRLGPCKRSVKKLLNCKSGQSGQLCHSNWKDQCKNDINTCKSLGEEHCNHALASCTSSACKKATQ